MIPLTRHHGIVHPVALCAMLIAAPAKADISGIDDRVGEPLRAETLTTDAPLTATCWQHGRKIFQQSNVAGLDLGSALRNQSLSLKQQGQTTTSTIIVPVDEAVCIVSTQQ